MSMVLLVLAVLCAAIAALLGFNVFSGAHTIGWLALSLAFGFGSFLVGAWPARS